MIFVKEVQPNHLAIYEWIDEDMFTYHSSYLHYDKTLVGHIDSNNYKYTLCIAQCSN